MTETGRSRMMLRAVAYGAYGGDRIGVLHQSTKISLTTSVSGVPTLRLTHTEVPTPALEEENEVAVEVSLDGLSPPAGAFSSARRRGTCSLTALSRAPSTVCTSVPGSSKR